MEAKVFIYCLNSLNPGWSRQTLVVSPLTASCFVLAKVLAEGQMTKRACCNPACSVIFNKMDTQSRATLRWLSLACGDAVHESALVTGFYATLGTKLSSGFVQRRLVLIQLAGDVKDQCRCLHDSTTKPTFSDKSVLLKQKAPLPSVMSFFHVASRLLKLYVFT